LAGYAIDNWLMQGSRRNKSVRTQKWQCLDAAEQSWKEANMDNELRS